LAKFDATTDEEIARQIAEDPDTAPELTDEWIDDSDLYVGDKFVRHGRPGRPKGSGKKELVTLRIDRDVLDHFRAGGPGWQTRMNKTLRAGTIEGEAARAETQQIEELRREAFAAGYATTMQSVRELASREQVTVVGRSAARQQRRSAARRPQRGSNAQMIEEVLQSMSPRTVRPAEIRKALQDRGIEMSSTSIRHALSKLKTRKASEPDGHDRSRPHRARA
jgi:uncharacterized protein (DUF4415 family)